MSSVLPRLISVRELVSEIPSRTYITHGLDRYPAKMVPHLARYAIEETSNAGDVVFDPFCGCGTVLVEATLLGRHSVGIDVNPVAVLLARTKSARFDCEKFAHLAQTIVAAARDMKAVPNLNEPEWLDYWFTERTLDKLRQLRYQIRHSTKLSRKYRDLLLTCLIISVRRCSLADPRSPKPFISLRARRNRVGRHFDAFRVYAQVADEITCAVSEMMAMSEGAFGVARAMRGDARIVTRKQVGLIDSVVTSPPYLSAQDYYRSSKLELAVAGLWRSRMERSLGQKIIGSGRGEVLTPECIRNRQRHVASLGIELPELSQRSRAVVADYLIDMRHMLRRIYTCLRPDGACCLVIGDSTIEDVLLPVHRWMAKLACQAGFRWTGHEVDLIRDRRVPPKREGHTGVIDREHLLFLQK